MSSTAKLFFLLALITITMVSSQLFGRNTGTTTGESTPINLSTGKGRDFRHLSIDKTSGTWLFIECTNEEKLSGCHIMSYDDTNSLLKRYLMSDKYLYSYPRFSDDGTKIFANRAPKHDGTPEGIAASIASSESISFASNGGAVEVVLKPYPNVGPVMSPSGNFVAYWKTAPSKLSPKSRMNTGPFDLYIFDLETKVETAYSGTNRFFAAGPIYFKSDEHIYSSATLPANREIADVEEYRKRTNGSEVFEFRRGAPKANAIFTNIVRAQNLSLDRQGNACLIGEKADRALMFFRVQNDGSMHSVGFPPVSFINEAVCTPSGEEMIFIYPATNNASHAERRLAFGRVNFTTGKIASVMVPPIHNAAIVNAN